MLIVCRYSEHWPLASRLDVSVRTTGTCLELEQLGHGGVVVRPSRVCAHCWRVRLHFHPQTRPVTPTSLKLVFALRSKSWKNSPGLATTIFARTMSSSWSRSQLEGMKSRR